jgi:ferrous iron transport protein B
VVPAAARQGEGIPLLIQTLSEVATGQVVCRPRRIQSEPPALKRAIGQLAEKIGTAFPGLPNARWVALRLLEGDTRMIEAVRTGELGDLSQSRPPDQLPQPQSTEQPAAKKVMP